MADKNMNESKSEVDMEIAFNYVNGILSDVQFNYLIVTKGLNKQKMLELVEQLQQRELDKGSFALGCALMFSFLFTILMGLLAWYV